MSPFLRFINSILCIIPFDLLSIRTNSNFYASASTAISVAAAEPALLFPIATCGSITLEEASINELQLAMTNGSLTSRQLVECYLDRIFQTNEYLQ